MSEEAGTVVGGIRDMEPRLAEVVQRLVQAYAPERIYLFGSTARGEAAPTATTI